MGKLTYSKYDLCTPLKKKHNQAMPRSQLCCKEGNISKKAVVAQTWSELMLVTMMHCFVIDSICPAVACLQKKKSRVCPVRLGPRGNPHMGTTCNNPQDKARSQTHESYSYTTPAMTTVSKSIVRFKTWYHRIPSLAFPLWTKYGE